MKGENNTQAKSGPLIMGILNLTPDSFSDGGKYNSALKAVKRVRTMQANGADIIDIGAESSGPGSPHISAEEELQRLLPVLKAIRNITNLPISIDTYKSSVAEACLQNGASIINDITAFRGDPQMPTIIKNHHCRAILMYSKDPTARTTLKPQEYPDIIQTILDFFSPILASAKKIGIPAEKIILDPGMGHFISSIPKYSYQIIARLQELTTLGHPLLLGISRKSFLSGPLSQRDKIGLPLTAIAYLNGASIIRTHNVAITRDFFNNFNG